MFLGPPCTKQYDGQSYPVLQFVSHLIEFQLILGKLPSLPYKDWSFFYFGTFRNKNVNFGQI